MHIDVVFFINHINVNINTYGYVIYTEANLRMVLSKHMTYHRFQVQYIHHKDPTQRAKC